MFLATKRLEGRSEKTLFLHRFNIEKMLEKSDKNVCVMNTDDISGYMSSYQEQNGVSKATVGLEDENYIFKSPLRRIHKIKLLSQLEKHMRTRNLKNSAMIAGN